MEAAKIVLFATAAAICFGILHDQVTAHLCVEYFTIAHPPIFPTQSPFWLAIGWGIIATWWVGLPLGIALALAARVGDMPRLGVRELRRPVLLMLLGCATVAFVSGIVGASLLAAGWIWLLPPLSELIPPNRQIVFMADAWAHGASYVAGLLGGLAVICHSILRRLRLAKEDVARARPD